MVVMDLKVYRLNSCCEPCVEKHKDLLRSNILFNYSNGCFLVDCIVYRVSESDEKFPVIYGSVVSDV